MAYARSGPTSEVQQLQQEITDEVNGDAEHLARAVFGKPGNMPDMRRVSDEELSARYRNAYANNDREWLTSEAHRDPEQFIKTARGIGVMLPDEFTASGVEPPVPAAPTMPAPPAPTSPVVPPVLPAPAPVAMPPGVTLGAVGQPGQPVPFTVPPGV